MHVYKYTHYINNYPLRYVSNKTVVINRKQLPKISTLTLQIYYNPYRYEYPDTYINDFIFIWYKHTQTAFSRIKNFNVFKKKIKPLKFTEIKKYALNQTYSCTDQCFKILKILNQLTEKNTIKETLFSTPNLFIYNKKNKFITYNLPNHNIFLMPVKRINFEQLTKGYNFILNPLDFYTEFKFTICIKNINIYPQHSAWLLNFISTTYFFTTSKHSYKRHSR